ncbi:ABC transporter ATP-binding protein [Gallintestinimicrobium propionicum]|uniref:ABC transporter ATP-binding protein/permease n=1 Tax=Gallintestinimicrobium propionicum TaxID=2981770 RepID=A0AAE3ART7_9FIRM|nr:ABC transporter ATP-binding protein [Gallintestinimicrobium propionicum]MCC2166634.1 ABC transporter ATP-binding protein/permease [Gallintestinimicrobium propionicum]
MVKKLRYVFDRKDKMKLVGLAILMIIGSVLELLAVAVFNPFIEVLMQTSSIEDDSFLKLFFAHIHLNGIEQYLVVLSALIAVIYLVKNIYLSFLQNVILSFSYTTRMNLATRLLTTYMNEPYTFHLSKNIAEMQRCLQSDTSQFMTLISSGLQLTVEMVTCLALAAYLFHTSHSITVVIGVLLLMCIGLFFIISKKVSSRLGRQNEHYNAKLFQWINQSLGGIKELKILQREEYFIDSYKTNYKKLIWGARVNELIAALPKYIVETVAMVGLVFAIIIKLLFGHGALETFIPQIAVFAVAAFRLLPSVGRVNAYINSIMYNKASLDMIYDDLKEIDSEPVQEIEWQGKKEKWIFTKGVTVEHVSYHYPDSDVEVLHDISLEIPKGKTVALIGPSGAGKTTLADIILGLLPPVSGVVRMDQHNVYENLRSWREKLGYIPQSIYLSDDTIRNNVAFGIYEAQIDDNAIWKALEKAQLKEFVQGLEKGLDTCVGDRGVRLSGGQRQRIGIARALYHDPEILVLDEATSALDSSTEQAVMESIESLQGLKTMIIIAHRLTTIKNADLVYEVSGGNVTLRDKNEVIR